MKFMKLGSRPDAFYSSKGVRSISSEVRTDLIIQVTGTRFLLHKFPLLSKSLKLQRLCSANTESSQCQIIELAKFPGGIKAFELCAKFCYGITITLSAYNIVSAQCAAKYLQMTEDVEKGNLIHKLEIFFNSCILKGWKDCIVTLQTTKPFQLWSEELGITSRCIESLVSKVLSNPTKVVSHSRSNRKGDVEETHTTERWWGDYLSELRIDLYWRTMTAIKSRGKVPPKLIGDSLKIYTAKWLPKISRKLEKRSGFNSGSVPSSSNSRMLLESIITLLPIERKAVSCSFLLKLLKAVNIFQASGSSKLELARRVALQLDEARVCDLMIPSVPNYSDTIYDLDIFLKILEQFMLQSKSQQTTSQRTLQSADKNDCEFKEGHGCSSSAINGSMIKVSKLVDGYLQEIARDVNVPLSKFIALIKSVPELARLKHDDLYRAIDIYLKFYSGQAWAIGDEGTNFKANTNATMHLLCGCTETDSQVMVTYTVEPHDTLSDIANRLSAEVTEIESVNSGLIQKAGFIEVGWVLFVPMYKNGVPSLKSNSSSSGKHHKWVIIFGVLLSVIAVLLCVSIILMLMKRKRSKKHDKENPKTESKVTSFTKSATTHTRYLSKENMEGFDTERPLIYDFSEIAEATNNFDDARKIGEGGYGSVYFGILGEKEVAIKKMRSNKSKEFLAELKVLCKIHHINVVELLGFASGDDHLYLVYEFISNGSLSEHLHDPLLKGHQPLSWTARAQIALDAAKGIEYIHDHTKERYVHRDIKTSNILLDNRLRAKVADFGLAKFVGRTNDDDFIATRLVGTPGYLPPESVKELHVTTKTDVFAFGVVLAELITGKRALMRDNREPNKMKSLITVITKIFEEEEDPEGALVSIRDGSLRDSYPIDDLYKMAEISYWCLSEDPNNRPEIREVVESLA